MPSAVRVVGHIELRRALRNYSPDLAKELKREVAAALIPIVNEARGYVPASSPISGWAPRPLSAARFPFYDAAKIKSGIGYSLSPSKTNRFGWSSLARIENKSRVGAIFDTAGRINPEGRPQAPMQTVRVVGHANFGKSFRSGGKNQSNSNNPNAGRQFITALGQLYGRKKEDGRLIFRAWENNQGKAVDAYFKAIEKANANFNKITSSVKKAA